MKRLNVVRAARHGATLPSLQVGTFEAEVSAPGYITMRKLVTTWDATNGAGCMWFVLSPLLQKDQYVGSASAALRCAVVSAECGMSCATGSARC